MQKAKTFQDTSIGNFVFTITPTQAIFGVPDQYKRTLSLEKGMQTLGTLQQSIPIMSKERSLIHKFDLKSSQITFRIINDKNLNYQWTVYKVFDGGELQQIDCMQFSILHFWKNFVNEYEKQLVSLTLKTKDDKDHKRTMEAWKQISEQGQQKTANLKVKSMKTDFKLSFNIQARSLLDDQLEEYEKQRMARRHRQFERSQIRKSAVTATVAFIEQDQVNETNGSNNLKRAKTEQQNRLNIPTSPSSSNGKFLAPIHQQKKQLRKSVSHNQLKTLSREQSKEGPQNSLQLSSGIHTSLKKMSSLQKKDSFQQKDDLSISSRIKNEKPKIPNTVPVKSAFESQKFIIFYIIMGVIMLWLLYNLMHHTPKVEYPVK